MPLRIATGLIGAFFLLQALSWMVRPEAAASALGMPLLDGVGRSTQIGDVGALFVTVGVAGLLGSARRSPHWLRAGALLLGSAAVLRTLAWAAHGAAFATPFVAVEVVAGALLFFTAARFEAEGADPAP